MTKRLPLEYFYNGVYVRDIQHKREIVIAVGSSRRKALERQREVSIFILNLLKFL